MCSTHIMKHAHCVAASQPPRFKTGTVGKGNVAQALLLVHYLQQGLRKRQYYLWQLLVTAVGRLLH